MPFPAGSMRVMAPLIALLHAPVLGPRSWLPVAGKLSRAGNEVVVPALAGFTDGGAPYAPRLVRLAADQVRAGSRDRVVLVVHSGAGVFAPHLVAAVGASDTVVVFADAALPSRASGSTVTDAAFLPYLRGLATGGIVPPWPLWWPGEDLSPLFPDEAARRAVSAEAAPLPLGFFAEVLPALPGGWPPCRAAYLVFSEPYRREAGQAARAGWPVRDLPGGHLHMLVNPGEVAAAITGLAEEARAAGASLGSLP
jgi:hypothetical protein